MDAMIEAVAAVTIAICSGLGVLTTRLHTRILMLDKRIDQVELRVAGSCVTRDELGSCLDRIDAHVLRIEAKLDRLTSVSCVANKEHHA